MDVELMWRVVLAPPSLLAHTADGGGSTNPVVLGVGAVLLVGGVLLRVRGARPTWLPLGVLALGVAVLLAGVLVDAGSEAPAEHASVRIVEPREGEQVPAGEPVEISVALDHADIAESPTDAEGGHLHLYVDGRLQQMPYSTDATITLTPGSHEIRVEYVDARHVSFDPEVDTTIRVTAR